MIEGNIARDIKHPGLETTVAAKGFGLLQNLEKDVLNQIFALRAVPRDLQDKFVDAAMMPLEQGREARGVAVCDPLNKLFVCHGSHVELMTSCVVFDWRKRAGISFFTRQHFADKYARIVVLDAQLKIQWL
jgi:hypothetical protein